MIRIINLIENMNLFQKFFLNTGLSIFLYWFLDGFGFKPLEDILFKFLNIVFSWNFDSEFGVAHNGYFHPDFIFIFCITGIYIFKNSSLKAK